MKKSILLLLIILGFWSGLFLSNSISAQTSSASPNRIVVNQLISASWPVQMKMAVMTKFGKRQLLTCTVTNSSNHTIQNIEFLLSAYFPDGSTHGVSLWQQPVTLAPGQSLDFTHQIGTIEDPDTATDVDDQDGLHVDLQDTVVLSITNVKTTTGGWKADHRLAIETARHFASDQSIPPIEPLKY